MKKLLVVGLNSGLSSKDRERLTKAGYCAVEVRFPTDARLIETDGTEISIPEMTKAALTALTRHSFGGDNFVKLLVNSFDKKA